MLTLCRRPSPETEQLIALLQRVTSASVTIDQETVASIGHGMLALLGVERGDDAECARRLAQRLLAWRMFADDQGRMNLNLQQTGGSLLLVPQFTLAADTNSGNRPSFTAAAPPDVGRELFDLVQDKLKASPVTLASGRFGADMQVSLVNDGPVTFWLQT